MRTHLGTTDFFKGLVPGGSSEDYFAGLARADRKAERVINPDMAFFRLGGFPKILQLAVGTFYGCGHAIMRGKRLADRGPGMRYAVGFEF